MVSDHVEVGLDILLVSRTLYLYNGIRSRGGSSLHIEGILYIISDMMASDHVEVGLFKQ